MGTKLLVILLSLSTVTEGSQHSLFQVLFNEAVRYVETSSITMNDGTKSIDGKNGETRASMIIGEDRISVMSTTDSSLEMIACFRGTPVSPFIAYLDTGTPMIIWYKNAPWKFLKTVEGTFVGEPIQKNEPEDVVLQYQSFSTFEKLSLTHNAYEDDEWKDTVVEELAIAQQDAAAHVSSAAQWSVISLLAGIISGGK